MKTRSDIFTGALIFIITSAVFLFSHVHQIADSKYSMLLAESILHHRSFTLDQYAIPRLPPTQYVGYTANGDVYQLEVVDGHLYYFFPPGSSLLSLPYVALMNALGVSAARSDGTYDPRGETKIEASLAALLMACFACVVFCTARLLLSSGWSVLITFGSTLGTQVWSTASRALWSDTWTIFLIGFIVLMLVAQEMGKARLRPLWLASLLSWSYFVRPTNCIPIAAVTVYVLVYHRRIFAKYALTEGTLV